MQPKRLNQRHIYLLKSGASRTAHRALRPTMLFGQVPAAMLRHARVFWLNTYIRPNMHSNVQYCMKCPPYSTVAVILACSVRQDLAGHLGTHSAQCRKHYYMVFQDRCYTQPWLAENWQWRQQYENQTFVSWSPVLSCFTGSMHANSS